MGAKLNYGRCRALAVNTLPILIGDAPTKAHVAASDGMKFNSYKFFWKILFLGTSVVVLALALTPGGDQLPTTGWDKANHLLAFFTLCVLGLLAYPKYVVIVLLGLLLYGGLIEMMQSFTSNRFAEYADLAADAVGLIAGWCSVFIMKNKRWIFNLFE